MTAVPAAAAAGNWHLGDLVVNRVLAIPGTGNPSHLAENVAAAAIRLSSDEIAALDALAGH